MSKYQAYPEYQDSGIEWANQIPQHWNSASLSKLFEIKAGGDLKVNYFSEEKDKDHPFPIYTNANDEKAVYGYTSKPFFKGNSITVSGRGEVGYAVYRDHPFDAIIRLLVLSPTKKLNLKFFTYFIKDVIDFQVESSAIGQLSTSQISPFKVVFPAVEEQTQIAVFLDYETAKIDTLIEKQQQLIELLKEKRQAVISHAVTKGLNPDATMKDSGVEWLGEVPEHWVVTKTSYCSTSLDAFRIPIEANIRGNRQGQYPYYGASGVIDFVDDYLFDDDLILVCEDGWNLMLRTQPVARFVTGKIWVNNHAHILKPIDIDATLLAECIELTPLNLFISGMRQPKLTADSLKNIPVAYSIDKEEQDELVNFISKYKKQILQLTNKAQHSIELLQERRTALISAAVTGKIDVRNWIAPTTSSDTNEAAQEVTA
ncbi:restriction endonuclease subunit S [Photobacterium kishitanii]|uniref:restriction endonuclease subunit S n=1 Tax=Photobacterium kishitanii TaxID=318456 RepID=UPI0005D44C4F|nr:restriction endonuclease subunit S [Photobacterium kishitanii]KJG08859.1 hypothetical protein UB40_15810 [Photobacterium kishitanii]PSV03853.1 restriction endonuclease subunit S [Photobacterium kishitanii]PSV73927.1 restriction endonuclease subunit S [Photobacterium kishitanii]